MGNAGSQGVKGFQVSCTTLSTIIRLFFYIFLVNSLAVCVCFCHELQGVSGSLGDPGLPGPTGIRGEFGERVSVTI